MSRISEAELVRRIRELEEELAQYRAVRQQTTPANETCKDAIHVGGIDVAWDVSRGLCTFEGLPVAMMWVDTTLAGLLSGVQAMVGTERFSLALQSEGRNSVAADWSVISQFSTFEEGFKAIAGIAAIAGWGRWELVELNREQRRSVFRVYDSWESLFQKKLGVNWGSNMLAGKLAGYAGLLFGTNCWAKQTKSIAKGDACDEFDVQPSDRSVEQEIENLLTTDQTTRADMAVALKKLKNENDERRKVENELRSIQTELEDRVCERTEALAVANDQLKMSEQRFRSIVESSPMGMHIYELTDDQQLIFRGANPAADRIRGVPHDSFVGKTIEEAFPPLKETEVPSRYREVCLTGEPWHTEQVEYEGDEIKGSFEVYTFRTAERMLAVLFLDVTERAKNQKERDHLQAELHRSKKMEALGLLAGGVAHDLNNILSGLVGYPELLLSQLPKDSPLQRPLSIMNKSGMQAAAVVQDLLTVARSAATTKAAIDLNELVTEYLHSPDFKHLSEIHSGVQIQTHLNSDLLYIQGSAVHIRKVLMNLVSNAVEALDTQGTVVISTSNCYLDKPLSGYDNVNIGEYVMLSISDNGVGIAAEDLERIFEPFYTKKKLGRSGTGLGLAVVWNCVKDHGGYIDVLSDNRGTTFNIYLNAARSATIPEVVAEDQTKLTGSGEKILVVDDEPHQRELVSEILCHFGYAPHAVESGKAACAYLSENKVDLVVLDMIMPNGMNGQETYERLLKIRPGLPAIIVSGYAETEDVKQTLEMGAGAYIKKPFNLAVLLKAVHDELLSPKKQGRTK